MTEQPSASVNIQNVQQQYYDQRNLNVTAGADPQRVLEHVQAVESQAHSIVRETQRQAEQVVYDTKSHAQQYVHEIQSQAAHVVQETQKDAEFAIHKAQSQAASVEEKANQVIRDMSTQHRAELTRAQDVANQVQLHAQTQLREADAKIQQLMAVVESQHRTLETQRVEHREALVQVAALQNEVTMLRHSASTPTPAQDLNGAVNQKELMSVIESLRQEIRQTQTKPVQPPVIVPIATPPYDAMSACAGYPPGHSPKRFPEGPSPSQSPPPNPTPFKWSETATSIPQGSSGSSSSSSGGPPGPPGRGPSGGGSQGGQFTPFPNEWHSVGVGSADVLTEESVYRHKALQSIKIDSLPQDAGAFRGWKNGIITKLCSIDVTGHEIILGWILEALDPTADLNPRACMALPRLEAYIAAVLAEPKHLKGDLGVQFQAYCEQCQQLRMSPKGRFTLQMIAKRFQLDLNRGANLTQQSLLELSLDSYTQEGLSKFIERIELVLNSIPPSHQPSEMTKFTWLFSRLKPCRNMQRFIDRIKDAREGSHVKTWDWLYDKLQRVVIEMREDANEESVRRSLSPTKPKQDRPKGDGKGKDLKANVAVDTDDKGAKALPGPAKPKPRAKADSKGGGKGKEDGKQQPKAASPKSQVPTPKPKAKPKAEATATQDRSAVPCLFYPNGTRSRGENCPFFHDPKGKPAAKPKATAATLVPRPQLR